MTPDLLVLLLAVLLAMGQLILYAVFGNSPFLSHCLVRSPQRAVGAGRPIWEPAKQPRS